MVEHEAERRPTDPGGTIKKLINQLEGIFHIYESTQKRTNPGYKTLIWNDLQSIGYFLSWQL